MSVSRVKTRDYPIADPKRGVNYIKTVTSPTYHIRNEDKGWVIVVNTNLPASIIVTPLSVPVGSQIDFFKTGNSTLTFAAAPGIIILAEALSLATDNTGATLIKTSDTTYLLVGKLT